MSTLCFLQAHKQQSGWIVKKGVSLGVSTFSKAKAIAILQKRVGVCELWRLLNVHWRLQLSKKLKSAKNLSLNSEIWTSLPLLKKKVLKTFVHFFQKSMLYVKPILECSNQGGLYCLLLGQFVDVIFKICPNLWQWSICGDQSWRNIEEDPDFQIISCELFKPNKLFAHFCIFSCNIAIG